jgi:phosphatidate cytidylyltransferase
MDKNLVQRSLAGLVFLAVMIGGICWNAYTTTCLFLLLAILASYEFIGLINQKIVLGSGRFFIVGFQAILVVLSGLSMLGFIQTGSEMLVVVLLVLFVGSAALFILPNKIETRLALFTVHFISFFYVLAPFAAMAIFSMADWRFGNNFNVLYFFILIWTNDTMAYCCGRLFGKTKLAETISPKKTVEGFVGGIVFTTAVSIVIWFIWKIPVGNPIIYYLAPVIVGTFGTIGDLLESALKRWIGIKDSGTLIPGHGGLLDRFDGAIFAIWPYIITLSLLNR